MLLVSPERLNNPGFRDQVLPRLAATCGLLVVDEAHCISDWGHDFRPDYRRIRTLLTDLPAGIPVLATTATANARVTADVAEQLGASGVHGEGLGPEVLVLRGSLDRESLRLGVVRPAHARAASRLAGRPPRRAAGVRASSTASPSPPPRRSPTTCAPAGTTSRRTPGRPTRPSGWRWRSSSPAGRSRRWSRPARSGWASTRRSASWSTSAPRRPRSPTTSRSAGPAAAPTARPWSCCRSRRTATSGPTSPRSRSPARTRCATPSGCSARRAARSAPPPSRPTSTSAAPAWRRCSRCSTSTAPYAGSAAAGSRPASPGPTTRSATPG